MTWLYHGPLYYCLEQNLASSPWVVFRVMGGLGDCYPCKQDLKVFSQD